MHRFKAAFLAAFLLPSLALAQVAPTVYAPLARKITSGSNDTATAADFQNAVIWKSAITSTKTETLPACVSGLTGRWVMVADEQGTAAAYPITVTAASGTVYSNSNGYQITSNYGAAVFVCDGAATNWVVGSQFVPGTNVRSVSGTSDTILATDNGNLVTYNNASAVAVTLPQGGSAGFPQSAFTVILRNYGIGTVTITPTTSTINNGASSLALAQNQSAIIVEDASGNYQALISYSGNVTAFGLTSNTISKATGSSSLGNSSVSDNGTTVSTGEAFQAAGVTSTAGAAVSGGTTSVAALTASGNVLGPSPSAVTGSANIDPTSTAICGGVLPYASVSAGTLTFLSTWPAGCNVSVEATSSGLATIAAGSGATLHTACTTPRTRAQYSVIWLHGESTGVVNVSGDCG